MSCIFKLFHKIIIKSQVIAEVGLHIYYLLIHLHQIPHNSGYTQMPVEPLSMTLIKQAITSDCDSPFAEACVWCVHREASNSLHHQGGVGSRCCCYSCFLQQMLIHHNSCASDPSVSHQHKLLTSLRGSKWFSLNLKKLNWEEQQLHQHLFNKSSFHHKVTRVPNNSYALQYLLYPKGPLQVEFTTAPLLHFSGLRIASFVQFTPIYNTEMVAFWCRARSVCSTNTSTLLHFKNSQDLSQVLQVLELINLLPLNSSEFQLCNISRLC